MRSKRTLIVVLFLATIVLFDHLARRYSKPDMSAARTPTIALPPTATPSVYYIIDEIQEPRPKHTVDPVYPLHAYAHDRQGLVILSVIITAQGDVTDIHVLNSGGIDLDEAAIEAVKQWKYEPAILRSQAVPVYYNVTVRFNK